MTEQTKSKALVPVNTTPKLGKAFGALIPTGDEVYGSLFMPDRQLNILGLTPDKLAVPSEYHLVIQLCYDFYRMGGMVGRVVDRLQELAITEVRNGQRKTTDEQNVYFEAILTKAPSRLMRFLRTAALEYFLTGMVLPRVDWVEMRGDEISPDLTKSKMYSMPVFDLYPPSLIWVEWTGWGKKTYWLKIPDSTIKAIKSRGKGIKNQQLEYQSWFNNYPGFVDLILAGHNKIDITDLTDPILRKESSATPYPTPYLSNVLETLVFRQQLKRMDFAVASRVINAILLINVGNDMYPVTEENSDDISQVRDQILARQGNPAMTERLFHLFVNHTVKLTWIAPDTAAMLNQEKYKQVNEEIDEGLGFARILLTGVSRAGSGGNAAEVSTWAIQPQLEDLRSMLVEWMVDSVYNEGAKRNRFKQIPAPSFKPIRLQDFIKTAAVFAQGFKEGNISRTTRDESMGVVFKTETELMKDEAKEMEGLPAFMPTPYSPPPPVMGPSGRPIGSSNVPVNNRNSGVKPPGQKPTSRVKAEEIELWPDEVVVNEIIRIAEKRGLRITLNDIADPVEE